MTLGLAKVNHLYVTLRVAVAVPKKLTIPKLEIPQIFKGWLTPLTICSPTISENMSKIYKISDSSSQARIAGEQDDRAGNTRT